MKLIGILLDAALVGYLIYQGEWWAAAFAATVGIAAVILVDE